MESIQESLEGAFKMASRWDAILLLDEADAFLAKREGSDIERNSMIAGTYYWHLHLIYSAKTVQCSCDC